MISIWYSTNTIASSWHYITLQIISFPMFAVLHIKYQCQDIPITNYYHKTHAP